jgi:hypothetical protein
MVRLGKPLARIAMDQNSGARGVQLKGSIFPQDRSDVVGRE